MIDTTTRVFQREYFKLNISENICEIMQRKGISIVDLAKALDVTVKHLKKRFQDDNFTLDEIADICFLLGYRPVMMFVDKEVYDKC